MTGKVPGYGTIALARRSLVPIIILLRREPSAREGREGQPAGNREADVAEALAEEISLAAQASGDGYEVKKRHRRGISVTRSVKPRNPTIKAASAKLSETPVMKHEPGRRKPEPGIGSGPCARKAVSKPDIADQIGVHLRGIYDDVLAQPVPGRFLDLLQQLECTGSSRPKDSM